MTYGKGKPTPPHRLFEHSDRPVQESGKGSGGTGPISVAEFEKQITKSGRG